MAQICSYCGNENEDGFTVCQGCGMPLTNSTSRENNAGYWQIMCPKCGKIYRVNSADDKIEFCIACVDELEAEEISYVGPVFVCDEDNLANENDEANEQDLLIPQEIELVDVYTEETVVRIPKSRVTLGRAGTIGREYFEDYTQISNRHCLISFSDTIGEWTIENLSYTNPTEINGVYLEHGIQMPLRNKDRILLADLLFEVRYVY